jgi:hypothetical protein
LQHKIKKKREKKRKEEAEKEFENRQRGESLERMKWNSFENDLLSLPPKWASLLLHTTASRKKGMEFHFF